MEKARLIPEKEHVELNKGQDIGNMEFFNLTVLQPWSRTDHGILWLCACQCGRYAIVRADRLLAGQVKSCGCLQLAACRDIVKKTQARQANIQAAVIRAGVTMGA